MANKLLKSLNFGGADTYYVGWDSLQDPPFGKKEVELLNGSYEFVYETGGSAYYFENENIKLGNGGNILKITWDGTEYELVSRTTQGLEFWGNMMGDTTEPFGVIIQSDGTNTMMVVVDLTATSNVTHTVSIIKVDITKIDRDLVDLPLDIFNVKLSIDYVNGVFVKDKTFAEIIQAKNNGKAIMLSLRNNIYTFVNCGTDYVTFQTIAIENNTLFCDTITIKNDETITEVLKQYTLTTA